MSGFLGAIGSGFATVARAADNLTFNVVSGTTNYAAGKVADVYAAGRGYINEVVYGDKGAQGREQGESHVSVIDIEAGGQTLPGQSKRPNPNSIPDSVQVIVLPSEGSLPPSPPPISTPASTAPLSNSWDTLPEVTPSSSLSIPASTTASTQATVLPTEALLLLPQPLPAPIQLNVTPVPGNEGWMGLGISNEPEFPQPLPAPPIPLPHPTTASSVNTTPPQSERENTRETPLPTPPSTSTIHPGIQLLGAAISATFTTSSDETPNDTSSMHPLDASGCQVPMNTWEKWRKHLYEFDGWQGGKAIFKVIMWLFTICTLGLLRGAIWTGASCWDRYHRKVEVLSMAEQKYN